MARLLVLLASVAAGCAQEARDGLDVVLARGAYVLVARTVVGGDHLEFWHEPEGPQPQFGPFVVAARDASGRLLDVCEGEFRSTWRPYAESDRYSVLVGNRGSDPPFFFVYDSISHRFRVHVSPEYDVHDGFVILGDRLLFSSCKTPEPVWLVDLQTGRAVSLGRGAPQAAEFHVEGSTVLVTGGGETFELVGVSLKPSRARVPPRPPAAEAFDSIRVAPEPGG